MDVSVVIVTWNSKDIVMKCLQSVVEHRSARQMETIVVDNGSTDGLPELIRQRFPQIQLIQNDRNLGFSKAYNIGIRRSRGRYVCVVNSDIIFRDGCIDRMYEFMESNPTIGILGPNLLNPDLTLQGSCEQFPTLWNNFCSAVGLDRLFPHSPFFCGSHMLFHPHDRVSRVEVLPAAFWMIRRKALDEVGLLEEMFFIYCEDIDLCKRFWNAGWEVVFYPDAEVIHYHGGSSSIQPLKFVLEQQKSGLQYWKKHHGTLGVLGITLVKLLHHLIRLMGQTVVFILKPSQRKTTRQKIERSYKCILLLLRLYKAPPMIPPQEKST